MEGERDAILLSRYLTAWASLGSPTNKQIDSLASLKVKLLFFFDNDKPGEEIKRKIIRKLSGVLPLYEVTDYCGCKDPAELVEKKKVRKALRSIKKIV